MSISERLARVSLSASASALASAAQAVRCGSLVGASVVNGIVTCALESSAASLKAAMKQCDWLGR